MTTDQRCPECHFIEKHLASCSRQPTPTSSLEEARERVRLSHNYACDTTYPMPPSPLQECNCGAYQSLLDVEAAARAEVIREVEAQAEREHAIMWARTGRAWADAVEEDADLCRGRALRALSQGGEGKA